ncbi:cytochrome ubiquinol oxidase subunit I [Adhaeribacter arboris]|nr:cytochrome ubiquinol oxidase subunit I [Adhaeribacter arboris]
MDNLVAARLQMAVSLGWHIVFACIGMTMPVLMAYSEWK